jgi:hypothetical protein
MSFAFALVCFILGSALIALCLIAIPGRGDHGHGAPGAGHGHGGH